MPSNEAGRFWLLQIYPLLCQQRAMHFTQPAEIDEEDWGVFKAQGQQDGTFWLIPCRITWKDEVREWQLLLDHVARTICKSGGHKCGRGLRQEWEPISVKIRHATFEKLCTLTGGFSRADDRRYAVIPGTYCQFNMGCKYWTPVNSVWDAPVIKLPSDAPSRPPRESIQYLWIFEGAYEEEVGFRPGSSCHQRKQVTSVWLGGVL